MIFTQCEHGLMCFALDLHVFRVTTTPSDIDTSTIVIATRRYGFGRSKLDDAAGQEQRW